MRNFLELQCLVYDLVDFLELLMFINARVRISDQPIVIRGSTFSFRASL